MGHQVTYFCDMHDALQLEEGLKSGRHPVAFMRGKGPDPAPSLVDSLCLDSDDPDATQLWIVREADLPRVRWSYLEKRGLWFVDRFASPVIEYSPGYERDGTSRMDRQHPGRMWFQTGPWLGGEHPVERDHEFEVWADSKLRWVRRHWALINSDYYSPAALNDYYAGNPASS